MHGSVLLIELGGVLLALGIIGRLAARIGISPIPLYLVAGLAFGSGGILPLSTSEDFITTGAEIGVLLLLLTLGLEFSPDELVGNLKSNAGVGALDLVLGAIPGAAAAILLGWDAKAAVVLAGITAVSSSGIIAKVLADLRRTGNRETPAILSILVLEDLAMAGYLPVLTALLAGIGVAAGTLTVAAALGAVTAVLVLATRYSGAVSRAVNTSDAEPLLLSVLGLTLLVAGLADKLQVSAAVGAFLVGISLSGPVAHVARQMLIPLRDLFAAVFFVFFGLQTNPADIPPVLGAAVLLALASAAGKIFTGWVAARRSGVSIPGRVRAGATLIAHGEFSIVIAGLAVDSGQPKRLGALAAAFVLSLAALGPIAARFADPVGRKLAARQRRRRGEVQTALGLQADQHDDRTSRTAGATPGSPSSPERGQWTATSSTPISAMRPANSSHAATDD
jgi:CPA2 family monovalent cation:H+ antiporter-2